MNYYRLIECLTMLFAGYVIGFRGEIDWVLLVASVVSSVIFATHNMNK